MKRIFIITGKYTGRFFEGFFAFIFVYIIAYWIFSRIPVNPKESGAPKEYTVYITLKGVHSDFIFPIRNDLKDWGKYLNLTSEFAQDSTRTFLAMGWGEKNFFMKTKEWSDLTVGTALKTTFGLGNGAMHLVQRTEPTKSEEGIFELKLSKKEYLDLCRFVEISFLKKNNQLSRIKEHPYSKYDFFYDSGVWYSLTYTCNSWTNTGLKAGNQKACLWTPFTDGLLILYEDN